jgi:hypothetical protein
MIAWGAGTIEPIGGGLSLSLPGDNMRITSICLAVLIGVPGFAGAQQPGPLLPEDSRTGDRLTVTTASGTRFSGRLLLDDAGALVLRSAGHERIIAHTEVVRVNRRRNRFLFGPLIGLGVGLAVGLPLKTRFDNEAANGDGWLGLMVGLGVGIGSLVDLLNGSDRTIFSRPDDRRDEGPDAQRNPF